MFMDLNSVNASGEEYMVMPNINSKKINQKLLG